MSVEKAKPGGGWWAGLARGVGLKKTETAQPGEPLKKVDGPPELRNGEPVIVVDERNDAKLGQVADAKLPTGAGAPVQGVKKPWETRVAGDSMDVVSLALAANAVVTGVVPLEVLTAHMRGLVKELVDGGGEVGSPQAVQKLYQKCARFMTPDEMKRALGTLAVAANDVAHAATVVANHKDEVPAGKGDARDWHRTWGLRVIPDDDPTWRDPGYLVALNQESKGVRATSWEGRTSVTGARERFNDEWQQLAPGTRLMAFTESGSDAVSLAFQIATSAGRRRVGNNDVNPEMLYFDGVYGGGRGLAASMNYAGWGEKQAPHKKQFKIPSPVSTVQNPTDPAMIEGLKAIEAQALAAIRAAASKQPPIGAIFFEPILGARGVLFYRKEFVQQLRQLADELKLPIIADEVLTCGGRTGKFFAYEHYEGFKPDYVLFGKGLQVAGIASVDRGQGQASTQRPTQYELGTTTAGGDAVRMLKGAQVMKRIREGGLMEKAQKTGERLIRELREVQKFHGVREDASGLGLLIGMNHVNGMKNEVSHSVVYSRDRYMPPLTLTDDDVDAVIKDLKRKLPHDDLQKIKQSLEYELDFRDRMQAQAKEGPLPEKERLWLAECEANIVKLEAQIKEMWV